MLRVGLTGGIGAGKSAVAKRLAKRGALIIDADRLARKVVAAGTDGLAAVVAAFGPDVLGPEGRLDRPALGARVFGDEAARRRLESIIHPRVRARTAELIASAAPDAIVVNDVPLLVEAGLAPTYHLVIVVQADTEVRIRRLVETRGMTEEQAAARIAAQATDEQRRAAADVVLDNSAGLGALNARVDRLWRERLQPYERNVRHSRVAPSDGLLRLVDHDPTWAAQAERLIARIRHAVGPPADVSHIGSTAVPGLPAKDLIDLMLAVPTLDEADALADALARAGLPRRRRAGSRVEQPCPGVPRYAAVAIVRRSRPYRKGFGKQRALAAADQRKARPPWVRTPTNAGRIDHGADSGGPCGGP